LGYAFAFATGVLTFGHISAHLNPAVCLSLLILGKIGGTEFAAAVAGEFLGAFLGACLVWLHYVVHFKTVPEPPSSRPEDLLLRSRDAMDATALGIASYTTKEEDVQARQRGLGDLRNVLADIKFYLSDMHPSPPDSDEELVRVALGPDQMRQSAQDLVGSLRRRSVQVGDVHRRLKDYDMQKFKALMALPHVQSFAQMASTGNAHGLPHSPSVPHGLPHSPTMPQFSNANKEVKHGHDHRHDHHPVVASHQQRLDRLYDQAVIADANAKLSVFCTRPALYSPLFNFITEFLCTTALVFGALMIYARREQLYGPERTLFRAIGKFGRFRDNYCYSHTSDAEFCTIFSDQSCCNHLQTHHFFCLPDPSFLTLT
jgi:glycerol uptake facilitator-like aquaporin